MVNYVSPWVTKWHMTLAAIGLAAMLTFAAFVSETRAEAPAPTPEIDKIRGVVSAQIEAFKHDDAKLAFSLATPEVQAMMGTPERFISIVREQYLPVYRPKKIDFRTPVELSDQAGVMQPAVVVGPDNLPVYAVYTVERQQDGAWRISGCLLYKLMSSDGTLT